MTEEAFKIKLKWFENRQNTRVFYCDSGSTGKKLINIGYGFLLNTKHDKPDPEILWDQFDVKSFGWNGMYEGTRPQSILTKKQIEDAFMEVYDKGWSLKDSITKSLVEIKDDIVIEALFEEKYTEFYSKCAEWFNRGDSTDIDINKSLDNKSQASSTSGLAQFIRNDYAVFPSWSSLPDTLKWVVIDICYNAGAGSRKEKNGLQAYALLKRALKTGDFDAAIEQCKCGVQELRNFFKRDIIYKTKIEWNSKFDKRNMA